MQLMNVTWMLDQRVFFAVRDIGGTTGKIFVRPKRLDNNDNNALSMLSSFLELYYL